MGRTHALAGIASLWLLRPVPEVVTAATMAPLAVLAALGALLPDLDAGESKIKRLSFAGLMPLAPLSLALHRNLGHRGLLHSLLGLGLSTLIFLPLASWGNGIVPLALSLGYASHLATDACTRSGVPLLYPRPRRYHLLPRGLRITTGSLAEEVFFVLFAMAALLLLLSYLPLAGVSTGIPLSS